MYSSELGSYLRLAELPWWSRYVSIKYSGIKVCGASSVRRRSPKRCSHSGPERYEIVAISL